jgi:hypothetical protein
MLSRLFATIIFSIVFFCVRGQVQLQTGSGNYSIPMFNWQDDKSNLKTFISLVYNSGSGLKVNEVASNVGQGWNLISGGVITRMQAGEPDDQYPHPGNTSGGPEDISRYPAGYLYAQNSAALGYPLNITKYPLYRTQNQQYKQRNDVAEDKELDYFYFQYNGKSGVFVIDTLGQDHGVALNDERIKITFQHNTALNYLGQNIRTTIQSFTIQDVDGLKYKFSTLGIGKILQTKYCDRNFAIVNEQPKFKNDKVYYQRSFDDPNQPSHKPWVVNSWYLTEIEDPLTLRKIIFSYNYILIDNMGGDDVTYINSSKNGNSNKRYAIVNRKKVYAYTQDISSVTFPDGHTVDFSYGGNRLDYSGKPLQTIDVKYNSRYLSRYKLNTSYFILRRTGTPTTDEQKRSSRLCLASIQQYGVDLKEEAPPYKFDYYLGSGAADDVVPPYFTFLKDNWGYYNGLNTKAYSGEISDSWNNTTISSTANIDASTLNFNQAKGICFLRENELEPYVNPKNEYAKNGLLKQVILPTGGTIKYNYGQNKGVLRDLPEQLVGGVHVSSTEATDGGYLNGCSNPLITHYSYILDGSTQSSLWGIELPNHFMQSLSDYAPESRFYQWKFWKCGLFGCCDWRFKYPGIPSADQGSSLSGFMQVFTNIITPALSVISTISNIVDIITLATGGGGGLTVAINLAVDLITGIISCVGDNSKSYSTNMYFSYDLNSISPLPMQFKRVEVKEGVGGNGKTIHEFTETNTANSGLPLFSPSNDAFSSKQRFFSWAYGLPEKIIYKNDQGNTVKEIINSYTHHYYPLGHIFKEGYKLQSAKSLVKKTSSQRNTDWTSAALTFSTQSTQDVNFDLYNIYSGHSRLTESTERMYQQPGSLTDFIETKTRYEYPTFYYGYNIGQHYEVKRIETINSNGDKTIKEFSYSGEYFNGVFDVMKQNQMITVPVSQTTTFIKNGGSLTNLEEKQTTFTQVANGNILPFELSERRYKTPSTVLPPFKVNETFTYGYNSKLFGIIDEGGRKIKKMYDYNDKFVVAEIINVGPGGRILYTSFENSNNTGEWTISGSTTYTSGTGVTGNRVLTLIPGSSPTITGTNLYENTSNPYRLSFWASGNNFYFTGGTPTLLQSGPVKNGFTFYEYQLSPSSTSITITVYGSAGVNNLHIDELRCYPINARMNTATYDPLIGKTSECDVNNRITYYEYDNLGRLQFIKDADKNIVKAYEYNSVSASKLNGCPGGPYSNRMISEDFRKSNCGSGYMGGLVTFTVPAGMFTSTISQEDADLKAEQQLLANGQSNANSSTAPGSCKVIYYNAAVSKTDTSENCPAGYVPGPVTYTVPYGRYSSTISQADADEQAQDDLDANFAHYADTHPNCTYSTQPFWEMVEPEQTQCMSVNGTPHLFYLVRDVNPHSSTYNQTTWKDSGPSSCTPTTPPVIYARMEQENFYSNSYYAVADIYIRFYADAGCTIPVVVNNINVTYSTSYYYYDCSTGQYNNYYEDTVTVNNSNEYCIGYSMWLSSYSYCTDETWLYSLRPGSGYTIVY